MMEALAGALARYLGLVVVRAIALAGALGLAMALTGDLVGAPGLDLVEALYMTPIDYLIGPIDWGYSIYDQVYGDSDGTWEGSVTSIYGDGYGYERGEGLGNGHAPGQGFTNRFGHAPQGDTDGQGRS